MPDSRSPRDRFQSAADLARALRPLAPPRGNDPSPSSSSSLATAEFSPPRDGRVGRPHPSITTRRRGARASPGARTVDDGGARLTAAVTAPARPSMVPRFLATARGVATGGVIAWPFRLRAGPRRRPRPSMAARRRPRSPRRRLACPARTAPGDGACSPRHRRRSRRRSRSQRRSRPRRFWPVASAAKRPAAPRAGGPALTPNRTAASGDIHEPCRGSPGRSRVVRTRRGGPRRGRGLPARRRGGARARRRDDGAQGRPSHAAARPALAARPRAAGGRVRAAKLDAELALTLEELAPAWRREAEVWVRLGRARARGLAIEEARDAFLRALAVAEAGSDARREVLPVARGPRPRERRRRPRRALAERLGVTKDADDAAGAPRRGSSRDDLDGAKAVLDALESDPTDGRATHPRPRPRARRRRGGVSAASPRARPRDARRQRGAGVGAHVDPLRTRRRARRSAPWSRARARSRPRAGRPRSRAEGRRDEGPRHRDGGARRRCVRRCGRCSCGPRGSRSRRAPGGARRQRSERLRRRRGAAPPLARASATRVEASAILDRLAGVSSPRARGVVGGGPSRGPSAPGSPTSGAPSDWTKVLTRLDLHARQLHALDATAKVAELAVERSRPVRVAIVGEFNAGRAPSSTPSSAPTWRPRASSPTTATLHHLRATRPIRSRASSSTTTPSEVKHRAHRALESELRAALKSAGEVGEARRDPPAHRLAHARRDPRHPGLQRARSAPHGGAREAFEEADAAIWLLDAGWGR